MQTQIYTHIHWMIRAHLPSVLAMEEANFDYEGWGEEALLRCLWRRNTVSLVAECEGNIVAGYMIYELHKEKLALLRLVVLPDFQRSGVGTQLVARLISKLRSHQREKITVEVPETNLAAQLFLRRQGFLAVDLLRCSNEEGEEGTILMEWSLEK